jgi:hypothetical protein
LNLPVRSLLATYLPSLGKKGFLADDITEKQKAPKWNAWDDMLLLHACIADDFEQELQQFMRRFGSNPNLNVDRRSPLLRTHVSSVMLPFEVCFLLSCARHWRLDAVSAVPRLLWRPCPVANGVGDVYCCGSLVELRQALEVRRRRRGVTGCVQAAYATTDTSLIKELQMARRGPSLM